ncbi:MAG: helix-turn-helix domain-containing protein [Polyangiaceae bacterium]
MDTERAPSATLICEAATRLFARQGFDGTSLQAIAAQVGISKPTLLYHYPSKDALRAAVLENLFAHWRRMVPQLLEAVTSGHARFEALTNELIRFFREDPDRALLLMRELLDRPAHMREQVIDNLRPWLRVVAEYIRTGKRIGQIREDVDEESYLLHVVTLTIATLSNTGLVHAALAPERTPESVEERHLAELRRFAKAALFRE